MRMSLHVRIELRMYDDDDDDDDEWWQWAQRAYVYSGQLWRAPWSWEICKSCMQPLKNKPKKKFFESSRQKDVILSEKKSFYSPFVHNLIASEVTTLEMHYININTLFSQIINTFSTIQQYKKKAVPSSSYWQCHCHYLCVCELPKWSKQTWIIKRRSVISARKCQLTINKLTANDFNANRKLTRKPSPEVTPTNLAQTTR